MSFIKAEGCSNITIENCTFEGAGMIDIDDSSTCFARNNKIVDSKRTVEQSGDGNTLMLIGNGINFSLANFLSLKYNTQEFLSWDFLMLDGEKITLEEKFPVLNEKLKELKNINIGDFQKIEMIISTANNDISMDVEKAKNLLLICEIEHYLMIAFSNYQEYIDKCIAKSNFEEWEWSGYIKRIKQNINSIISLNYDLVMERLLQYLNISYKRIGVKNEFGLVKIFKPHGSIDYVGMGITAKASYPLKSVYHRNDTPISRLNRQDLLKSRLEVNIVPPTQYTEIENFQWVSEGYRYFENEGNKVKKFIIVGMSYWECDRPEIKKIINSIHPNCEVININPDMESKEMKTLKEEIVQKVGCKRYNHYNSLNKLCEK